MRFAAAERFKWYWGDACQLRSMHQANTDAHRITPGSTAYTDAQLREQAERVDQRWKDYLEELAK